MNQCELQKRISEVQFVCIELNLYLDTHPDDQAARNDYYTYSRLLDELITEYETEYGPLLGFGHSPTDVGCWVCSEWPWERK
ncbi:MAG: spore coat protein CotJB [Clostridiales bacterium]|nr:spore coat protein CotJB [Clostridiales bacterium]